jgi:hypothetical protein
VQIREIKTPPGWHFFETLLGELATLWGQVAELIEKLRAEERAHPAGEAYPVRWRFVLHGVVVARAFVTY